MSATTFASCPSPIGTLRLIADAEGLREIRFAADDRPLAPGWREDVEHLAPVLAEIAEYFAGERRAFDLRLAPRGTPFQRRVWDELCRIPYGETISYGELARRIGRPDAVRAVGASNGRNPLPIVIPCHRVIGASGGLVGYGGGLAIKRRLLALESGGAEADLFSADRRSALPADEGSPRDGG